MGVVEEMEVLQDIIVLTKEGFIEKYEVTEERYNDLGRFIKECVDNKTMYVVGGGEPDVDNT